MSLAERLAQATRDKTGGRTEEKATSTSSAPTPSGSATAMSTVDTKKLRDAVHAELLEQLGSDLYGMEISRDDLSKRVLSALQDVINRDSVPLGGVERTRLAQEISDDILGYGPIEPLLRDADITEVMVNAPDAVYVERAGRLELSKAKFADEMHVRRTIDKIVSRVGRRIDESSPMVDARLLDGSRVNAIIPPLAVDHPVLTVRKFAADPFTDLDLIDFGTMSPVVANFLEACVRGKLNILVSGGTGAGKTTTLNVLSGYIPNNERIVTIEDAAELQLHQEHVVRLEARPANIEGRGEITIRDLVKNSLRMRPDRIVVGEVRDRAALDMLQAMNTGHDGSICTVHANSPRDVLSRVETMVLMAGVELPVRAIREQVSSAIDLVVQQTRLRDGSRKITHISEVVGMEGETITMQDIFLFDEHAGVDQDGHILGQLQSTGLRPKFLDKLQVSGVTVDPAIFAFEHRGRKR